MWQSWIDSFIIEWISPIFVIMHAPQISNLHYLHLKKLLYLFSPSYLQTSQSGSPLYSWTPPACWVRSWPKLHVFCQTSSPTKIFPWMPLCSFPTRISPRFPLYSYILIFSLASFKFAFRSFIQLCSSLSFLGMVVSSQVLHKISRFSHCLLQWNSMSLPRTPSPHPWVHA